MNLSEKLCWHLQQKKIEIQKFFYSIFIKKVNIEGIY